MCAQSKLVTHMSQAVLHECNTIHQPLVLLTRSCERCSFKAFFEPSDAEDESADRGSTAGGHQQCPSVIVLLPLLLGLGKVFTSILQYVICCFFVTIANNQRVALWRHEAEHNAHSHKT